MKDSRMHKWNTMPITVTRFEKSNFGVKSKVIDNKVIDLDVIWKGIISLVCSSHIKAIPLTVQKV